MSKSMKKHCKGLLRLLKLKIQITRHRLIAEKSSSRSSLSFSNSRTPIGKKKQAADRSTMRTTGHHYNHQQARGFYTPPLTRDYRPPSSSNPLTPAEPKLRTCQTDDFHIRHKLPAGDSPYVKAKHVQLVDKNPGKAVSLFWAAINSGDRVDSALKDMAVVMKQLDRSDEAIEAIRSFRSLCLPESQDSIDNVLVELYKGSGRIEEEIVILLHKLKCIEEGATFGGKRWKFTRSQGRRVQVTVEQETARILGNLAWAYLQLGKYTMAEEKYKKGLLLDPDKNMQCNLAYCLLQTRQIEEAKLLLEAVKSSSEDGYMDESYAKSYERAFSMLSDLEQEKYRNKARRSLTAPLHNCRSLESPWKAGWSVERRMNSENRKNENRCCSDATVANVFNGFRRPRSYQDPVSSSPALLTQPRCRLRPSDQGQRKKLWNGWVVGHSSRKLSFEQPNIDNDQTASDYQIGNGVSPSWHDVRKCRDWKKKALEALPQSDMVRRQMEDDNQRNNAVDNDVPLVINGNPSLSLQDETKAQQVSDDACPLEADEKKKQEPLFGPSKLSLNNKKSWADMVEEDEFFGGLATLKKENINSNLPCTASYGMTKQTEDGSESFIN